MDPVFLHNPSLIELDDAFRGLTKLNTAVVKTSSLKSTIFEMEKIGFVAILVKSMVHKHQSFTIEASKGKHGPCFYSGKSAEYIGKAHAALDDDHHIYMRDRPKSICDKTSNICNMDVFYNLLQNRDDSSQLELDTDDFEKSQENLFNKLKFIKPESERKVLFYPGPFRFLILDDGTIIRRGRWASIPASMARNLINDDGFKSWESAEEVKTVFFQEVYMKEGTACLMEGLKPKNVPTQSHGTDYKVLHSISNKLKERLIDLIRKERKYFILIGNEADDKIGCCPSEEVSEANSLVHSGILEALSEATQSDACPVTLYAFKNELAPTESGFTCKPNSLLREKIYKQISKSSRPVFHHFLKWILLVFVTISLLFAVVKVNQYQQKTTQQTLAEALDIAEGFQVQLVLFHNKKRCFQCERMERFTKEILEHSFTEEVEQRHLVFNTITIDDPANMSIVEQFNIIASTIVLLKFDNKTIVDTQTLFDVTKLYQDEEAFKARLEREIHTFLNDGHD